MYEFPYGAEFSPNSFKLTDLHKLVLKAKGNPDKAKELIQKKFWPTSSSRTLKSSKTLAMNSYLTMKSYGLIEENSKNSFKESDLFNQIAKEKSQKKQFALLNKHLLINRYGLIYLKILEALKAENTKVTMESINQKLIELGFKNITLTSKYISTMKMWFEKSLLFKKAKDYDINWKNVKAIIGITNKEYDQAFELSEDQLVFLKSLVNIGGKNVPSNNISKYAKSALQHQLPEKILSSAIITPLANKGFISSKKVTKGSGAKPHLVTLKKVKKTKELIAFFEQIQELPEEYRFSEIIKHDQIIKNLKSKSIHDKGVALEQLSVWFIKLLNLKFKSWRERSADNAYSEVDVLAESNELTKSTWQIQCKNTTSTIGTNVLAREIGLALLTEANVVMVVTTSTFSENAKKYSQTVHEKTKIKLILLDGEDIKNITSNPSQIADIIKTKLDNNENSFEEVNEFLEIELLLKADKDLKERIAKQGTKVKKKA